MADAKSKTTTSATPQRKAKSGPTYSFATRMVHWILARIGLVQTVFLFLWLAERAKKTEDTPFSPWIIYAHAAVGLVASTGLSARFLARISLYALTAVQLHVAYLYIVEPKLDYSLWLRLRVALRSLAVAAVYLRMLGCTLAPASFMGNGKSTSSKSAPPTIAPQEINRFGTYSFGLTLLSIFTGLMGLLSIPADLVTIDAAAQQIELKASWSIITAMVEPWFGMALAMCFLTASVLYTLPQLVSSPMLAQCGQSTIASRFSSWADLLTLIGMIGLVVARDSRLNYWTGEQGAEFWLQAHLLLNSAIVVAGLIVTGDLISAVNGEKKVEKREKSE